MDIIGISEARWTGSEMMKERSGHTVIHSGREDNQHTEGIAIIMPDTVAKTPHPEHLLTQHHFERRTTLDNLDQKHQL